MWIVIKHNIRTTLIHGLATAQLELYDIIIVAKKDTSIDAKLEKKDTLNGFLDMGTNGAWWTQNEAIKSIGPSDQWIK